MISWGLEVNDYGNAKLDDEGNFIKVEDQGVSEDMWQEMLAYANEKGLKGGNYKKLNLPFESKLLSQPLDIRERMANRVEDFIYNMLTTVLYSEGTAPLVIEAICKNGTHDPGPKASRIEDPAQWTPEKIAERAQTIDSDKGPAGNFDD